MHLLVFKCYLFIALIFAMSMRLAWRLGGLNGAEPGMTPEASLAIKGVKRR
jgi:hypothetical protein